MKKKCIFVFIFCVSFIPLFATANDGNFSISINNWHCSIAWGLDVDLPYLNTLKTYYQLLHLTSDNYTLIGNVLDFEKIINTQISIFYNIKSKSNILYLYKLQIPENEGDIFRDRAEIKLYSSVPTKIVSGHYEYYFLNKTIVKEISQNKYLVKTYKIQF